MFTLLYFFGNAHYHLLVFIIQYYFLLTYKWVVVSILQDPAGICWQQYCWELFSYSTLCTVFTYGCKLSVHRSNHMVVPLSCVMLLLECFLLHIYFYNLLKKNITISKTYELYVVVGSMSLTQSVDRPNKKKKIST